MNFVDEKNSLSMEELIAGKTGITCNEGELVMGTIIEKRDNGVLLDMGFKSESFVSKEEFTNWQEIEVGQKFEVYVEKLETASGEPLVSYDKALHQKTWDKLVSTVDEGSKITGTVFGKVKGGLIVTIEGIDTFLPGSHIDIIPVKSVSDLVETEIDVKILKINREEKNIIVSRRLLLEEERSLRRDEILENFEIGDVCEGTIKNILNFGAFIDLNGLDGLLHITDISWNRISHPSEVLNVGDKIEVMIIDIDREKKRVNLGLKQKIQDPWLNIEEKYKIGDIINTKVINVMPYGTFVQLEEGIEGLIHSSEISWTKKNVSVTEFFQPGNNVEAMIIAIDNEDRKISLSYRKTTDNPWLVLQEQYPLGTICDGEVVRVTNYSALISILDNLEGELHISDMSWTRKINHPNELLKKGQKITVKILNIDEKEQRLRVGMKQVNEDPWQSMSQYKIGDVVDVEVVKIINNSLFSNMKNGIECYLHASEANISRTDKIKDHFKLGDNLKARIITLNLEERNIQLSLKELNKNQRLDETSSTGGSSVKMGDLLDDALKDFDKKQ